MEVGCRNAEKTQSCPSLMARGHPVDRTLSPGQYALWPCALKLTPDVRNWSIVEQAETMAPSRFVVAIRQ